MKGCAHWGSGCNHPGLCCDRGMLLTAIPIPP